MYRRLMLCPALGLLHRQPLPRGCARPRPQLPRLVRDLRLKCQTLHFGRRLFARKHHVAFAALFQVREALDVQVLTIVGEVPPRAARRHCCRRLYMLMPVTRRLTEGDGVGC